MGRKAPPPPFGLDERTYAQLWYYALPVLAFVLGLVVLVALMGVLSGAWKIFAVLAGGAVGTAVVAGGRALHRRLEDRS
ncbi:hypothetical protein ACIO6U_23495 [Streptomyces sp. NPDC087422]|uniref:hypothetical protein n=1 Tax=Streptomyces sp. NPDC087422 TaxID=3365786 RepID=UPI00382B523D